jgi:hypothetical protein
MYFDWNFDSEGNDVVFLKESRETYYAAFFKSYSWHHHKCCRIRFTNVPAGKILNDMLTDVEVSMVDVKPSFLAGLKRMGAEDIEFTCAISNGIRKERGISLSPYPVDITKHYIGFAVPYVVGHRSVTREPIITYIDTTDIGYYYGAFSLSNDSFGLKKELFNTYEFARKFKKGTRSCDPALVTLLETNFIRFSRLYGKDCVKVVSLSDHIPGFGTLPLVNE